MIFIGEGLTKEYMGDTVWEALEDYNIVIIEKVEPEGANPVYNVYATTGKLQAGQIKEE